MILAEVTVYTPFVLRPLLAAFSLVDQSQIEVAGLLGAKPWRIVRSVILPAALPAAIAGGSLCLLLTVNEFGIVLFIGAKGVITLPLSDLRQGDPGVGLSDRLHHRGGQHRPLARPLALSVRRPAAGRLSAPCLSWSRSGRFIVWLLAALLIGVIFILPLAVILAASLARQWNGVLPTGFTLEHYAAAGSGALAIPCSQASSPGLSRAFSRFFADHGRRWLCARKERRGAGP